MFNHTDEQLQKNNTDDLTRTNYSREMFFLVLLLYLISSASSVSSSSSGCPSTSIIVTALILPPYVIYHNSTSFGIAIDFVRQSIKKCFRSCNLPPVQWNIVNTSTALKKAILSKSTDIAFPIVPSMEQEIEEGELDVKLISNVYNSTNNSYVFENLIGSPGMSFIIHTNNFNKKARQHIIDALLEIWPIVVFCILLAGMSGIFVWAVVSLFLNILVFNNNITFLFRIYNVTKLKVFLNIC